MRLVVLTVARGVQITRHSRGEKLLADTLERIYGKLQMAVQIWGLLLP